MPLPLSKYRTIRSFDAPACRYTYRRIALPADRSRFSPVFSKVHEVVPVVSILTDCVPVLYCVTLSVGVLPAMTVQSDASSKSSISVPTLDNRFCGRITSFGPADALFDGLFEADEDGLPDGEELADEEGEFDAEADGLFEGLLDADAEGLPLSEADGLFDGDADADADGDEDGLLPAGV